MSSAQSPRGRRFGPRHLGNRKGRPKGARNVKTIVEEFALKRHKIKEGGSTHTLSTIELLFKLTAQLSLEHVEADKLIERYRKRLAPPVPEGVGVMLAPETLTPEEWLRREEIKALFAKPPNMDPIEGFGNKPTKVP